jgi:hypothetical protein
MVLAVPGGGPATPGWPRPHPVTVAREKEGLMSDYEVAWIARNAGTPLRRRLRLRSC